MSSDQSLDHFSVQEAREIVKDLFVHREWIYWLDFLVTTTIAYSTALVYLNAPLGSPLQIICFLVAGFALFRVASFMHEVVHMSGKTMLGFRIAWNVLAGIPMLMPSFFYNNHIDHHSTKHFGTGQDGEYLPLGNGTRSHILGFVLPTFFLPIAVLLRFLILAPISFLHPRLRRWTLEHASSFVMNLSYRHQIPKNAPLKMWALLEFLCFLRALAMVGYVAIGMASPMRLVLFYLLGVVAHWIQLLTQLGSIITIAATGNRLATSRRLADSINITRAFQL